MSTHETAKAREFIIAAYDDIGESPNDELSHANIERYAQLLTQREAAARLEAFEHAAKEIERPYPKDVFTPFTGNELGKLSLIWEYAYQQVPNFSDKLHANWARHWAGIIRAQAELERQASGQAQETKEAEDTHPGDAAGGYGFLSPLPDAPSVAAPSGPSMTKRERTTLLIFGLSVLALIGAALWFMHEAIERIGT